MKVVIILSILNQFSLKLLWRQISVLKLCGYILAWYSPKASSWHVFMSTIVEIIWMHWSPWTLTRNEAIFITMIFVQSRALKCGMCCRTLTFDQPVYLKSFKIKEDNHPQFRHLFLPFCGGFTEMVASSSNFRPHPERVIRDLFHQLHAVRHGTEVLVYSNYPREAAACSYLAIIFERIASGVPWFLSSTAVPMHLLHQWRRWCRPWW